ncbi:MAG: hypothetical protein V4440_14575 [Pseudomonadota bacterium]
MSEELPVVETSQGEVIETADQAPALENAEDTAKPADTQADKTFTQAELDEIVQKRVNKLERKMERQRIESETRNKVMQEVAAKPTPAADKPKVEDYADYADFIEDLTDWKTDQKIRSIKDNENQEKAQRSQQSEQDRRTERQQELLENGERKYEDFEDVVKSDKTVYSQAAYLSILESDISSDIVYHLAKNQEEAKRIAALPAYAQAKEIGKLEDKLSAKAPVKTSNAPTPIKPIEGGKNITKKLEDMSYEEMLEHDRKRGARYLN